MKKRGFRLIGGLVIPAVIFFCPVRAEAQQFAAVMQDYKSTIIEDARLYGVWPSIIVGVAGVEAGTGQISNLAANHNNFWGICYSSAMAKRIEGTYKTGNYCGFENIQGGFKAFCQIWWNGAFSECADILYDLDSSMENFRDAFLRSPYFFGDSDEYLTIMKDAVRIAGAEDWDSIAFPEGRQYVPAEYNWNYKHCQVGDYGMYPLDEYSWSAMEKEPWPG